MFKAGRGPGWVVSCANHSHSHTMRTLSWLVRDTRLAWSRELELREGRRVCVCAVPAQHRGPQRAVRGVGLAARGGDV